MRIEREGQSAMPDTSSVDLALRGGNEPARRGSRALDIRRRGVEAAGLPAAFLELYQSIEVRRTAAIALVVQFMAASERAGASTVASGYARVGSVLSSKPVLFVDCGGLERGFGAAGGPPTLLDAARRGTPLSEAVLPARGCENLYWARLCPVPHAVMAFGGEGLNRLLSWLRNDYSLIVLDSASSECASAAALSRYCDGTILVVAAGRTREREITAARMQVERFGGQMVGAVLNRHRRLIPRWLERRL
jgi:Mrp family chromosome partitioning ATPase